MEPSKPAESESISPKEPDLSSTSALSERELELLRLVATGASNKEIAQQLHISVNTVKVHLRNIFEKTGAVSRTELAMLAVKAGLVTGISSASPSPIASPDTAGGNFAAPAPAARPRSARRSRPWRLLIMALVPVIVLIVAAIYLGAPGGGTPTPTPPALGDTPRWQAVAGLPAGRAGLAVAVYENRLFTIGGESAQGATDALERYDPTLDAWEVLAPKPTGVSEVRAAVLGGRIYVPGGKNATGQPVDLLEVYDPATNRWSAETLLPRPLSGYALAPFEGEFYLFGGWDGRQYRAEVYAYDPQTRLWTEKTPLPGYGSAAAGRAFLEAAVVSGKIFVFGGYNGLQALDANLEYSPEKEAAGQDPWQARSPLPNPRYAMGAASLVDLIVIVGGATNQRQAGRETQSVLVYSAFIDQWREYSEPAFAGWTRLGMTPLGMQFALVGGQVGKEYTGKNILFQPVYTVLLPIVP